MKLNSLYVLLISIVLSSCGDYQKVLKSNDPSLKLLKAKEYFELEQYNKALPIFDELMSSYRGTTKAQDVYKYYALTLYGQKDYILSGYHMKRFSNTFPNTSCKFPNSLSVLIKYLYSSSITVLSLSNIISTSPAIVPLFEKPFFNPNLNKFCCIK